MQYPKVVIKSNKMLNTQSAATSNNNTPVQAQEEFTQKQQTEIAAIVQAEVRACMYYGVQCVTTEKAAELLSVEPGTVRDWINSGKLPASKPGNTYLILLEDINRLLTQTAVVIRIDKRYKKIKAI
jgi:excisionase family DNA binding protein